MCIKTIKQFFSAIVYVCWWCRELTQAWETADGNTPCWYLHHSLDSWRPQAQPSVCPPSHSARSGPRTTPGHSGCQHTISWHVLLVRLTFFSFFFCRRQAALLLEANELVLWKINLSTDISCQLTVSCSFIDLMEGQLASPPNRAASTKWWLTVNSLLAELSIENLEQGHSFPDLFKVYKIHCSTCTLKTT